MEKMEKNKYQADLAAVEGVLKSGLLKYATQEGFTWLENKKAQLLETASPGLFFTVFSGISRYFGKELVQFTWAELQQAQALRLQWSPRHYSIAQLARIYFLISMARQWPDKFIALVSPLFKAADIQELIALYKALPLFPYPDQFYLQATEGIRSNMRSVFEAVALSNPYPADYFTELAWNQLILKTLFVDSAIAEIIGIKRRANAALAQMLINTAKERASADRPIKRELWYLVGISSDETVLKELSLLVVHKNRALQNGALLACTHSQLPEAKSLLENQAHLTGQCAEDLTHLQHFDQCLI